jgi:hypothetical protein
LSPLQHILYSISPARDCHRPRSRSRRENTYIQFKALGLPTDEGIPDPATFLCDLPRADSSPCGRTRSYAAEILRACASSPRRGVTL